jgi:integrase
VSDILPITERQGRSTQQGGWQDLARRRFQTGSIRKRGTRYPVWELQWWADYLTIEGKIGRKRESVILGYVADLNRKQAKKLAAEQLLPLNQGKLTPMATITFDDFIERFFVPNALPALKLSTRKRYRSTLNFHLKPAFGHKRLCDISTLDLQSFVLKKMDSGSGWEVCNHLRNLMSKVFVSAKKWGHCAGENPAIGVDLPEKIAVHDKQALTTEQCQRLLVALPEPVRTMVLVGILAGLRVGEILGLSWQDVDLPDRTLRIRQAAYRGSVGSPKTKGSKRTLPLPDSLVEALRQHYDASPLRDGLVFPTRSGMPYSDSNLLARHLKPAGKQIGAAWLSWHSLRRTHATLLSQSGASPKDAQAQLGHAHISTTMDIYTQPTPQHQREAVDRLAQLVTNGDELAIREAGVALVTTQIQ